MKKKKLFIIVFLFSVVAVGILWLVKTKNTQKTNMANNEVAAGLVAKKMEASSRAAEKILANNDIDEDLKEIVRAEEGIEEFTGQNCRQKIITAEKESKISAEEALILKIKAHFAPDKLPKEYQSDDNSAPLSGLQADILQIIASFDSLSPKAQKFLKPFILSPDNKKSYFNPLNSKEDFFPPSSVSFAPKAQAAVSGSWQKIKITAPGEPADSWVHYFIYDNDPQSEKDLLLKRAQDIKVAWQKAWPRYKQYLGTVPTAGTDVWISSRMPPGDDGVTEPHFSTSGKVDRCRIKITDSIADKSLKSTTVHELFHVFQFFYDSFFSQNSTPVDWLAESTATWSENFIYPDYNSEQSYLNTFFSGLNKTRIHTGSNFEYGSYMLFFFFDQYLGNQNSVAKIFQSLKTTHNVAKALIGGVNEFYQTYGDFAVYNWNRYPGLVYKDIPSFPKKHPYNGSVMNIYIERTGEESVNDKLMPGASVYDYFVFNPNKAKIKFIEFEFKNQTSEKFPVKALLKVGEDWQLRNLTYEKKVSFCRLWPGQDIRAAIIIPVNADLETKQTKLFDYTLTTSNKCPDNPWGNLQVSQKTEDNKGSYSFSSTFTAKQKIKYNAEESTAEEDVYDVAEQTLSCQSQEKQSVSTSFGPVPISVSGDKAGKGNLNEKYNENERHWQIKIKKNENKAVINLVPNTKNKNWVLYSGSGSLAPASNKKQGDCRGLAPLTVEVDYDGSGVLAGSKTIGSLSQLSYRYSSGGTANISVDYFYVLPLPK